LIKVGLNSASILSLPNAGPTLGVTEALGSVPYTSDFFTYDSTVLSFFADCDIDGD